MHADGAQLIGAVHLRQLPRAEDHGPGWIVFNFHLWRLKV